MEKRENGLEQIQKQASGSQAEEVKKLLDQGKYTQAESLAKEANLTPEDWAKVSNNADNSIREISPEKLPEGPLSADQAQKVVTGAEDQKILEYGQKNMPGMDDLKDLKGTVQESNQIIDELLELVHQAKSNTKKNMWAKPVGILALPVIADIYALIKGNKLRKQLKRLEKLNKKLENPNFLNSSLDADKISPNMGHKLTLAGAGTALAGVGVVAAASTNPVGMGVGLGMYMVGGVTALAGTIKQIIDFANMHGTSQSLKALEEKLTTAREQNVNTSSQIKQYENAYVQGARENLQPMMA